MKTFGQVIVATRLTQKAVAEHLRRADGRNVPPPYLNDLEHGRCYPAENEVIEELGKIMKISPDVLYFYGHRLKELANLTPKRGRATKAHHNESGRVTLKSLG